MGKYNWNVKNAYPMGNLNDVIDYPYDVQKWIKVMGDIYSFVNKGYSFKDSFNSLTEGWDELEKRSFEHWINFYAEGAHMKYKTANNRKNAQFAGNQISPEALRASLPTAPNTPVATPNMSAFPQSAAVNAAEANVIKKQEIEKKIKAIVGRLNSAEKISTEPEVQKVLNTILERGVAGWLESLQKIKRELQLAPIRSASSPLLEDIIIKNANILYSQGYRNTGNLLMKFAQPMPVMPTNMDSNSQQADKEIDGKEAINDFIMGLNGEFGDENDVDDDFASIVVEAQAMPQNNPQQTPRPVAPLPSAAPASLAPTPPKSTLNTSPSKEIMSDNPNDVGHKSPSYEGIFDEALSNVTIADIISELEAVANIFRTREIPRKLAMIDFMMDKRGISAYFPGIAEASSKLLEGNQYALTRMEDALSKLRGTMDVPEQHKVDLSGNPNPQNSEMNGVINELQEQDKQEKNRKEQRKQKELEKSNPIAEQPVDMGLDQPVSLEQSQPAKLNAPPLPAPVQPNTNLNQRV